MKRLMLALVVVALGGLTTAALAGDYHVGSQLVCSDCHVMHGTAAHASADSGTVFFQPVGGPFPYLLRGETVNNACLNCHDGRTDAPDVLCESPNPPTNGRLAGALNVLSGNGHGKSNSGNYTEEDGHTLWSVDDPPGLVGTSPVSGEGLECSNCHSVHGSANYRNLRSSSTVGDNFYNKTVRYMVGGAPSDTNTVIDVYERLPHDYDYANVDFLEPDQGASHYGAWCGSCHGDFHGAPGAAPITIGGFEVRHPTAGVNMSSSRVTRWRLPSGNETHRLKLMDAAAKWQVTSGFSTTMTPSCFTCHKSHGNDNKFGLVFNVPNQLTGGPAPEPSRSVTMTEQGDGGALRELCRNCHGSGTFPTGNPTNIQ